MPLESYVNSGFSKLISIRRWDYIRWDYIRWDYIRWDYIRWDYIRNFWKIIL